MTRRTMLAAMAGYASALTSGSSTASGTGAAASPDAAAAQRRRGTRSDDQPDVVVVGAGVFGAWTAWHLHRAGRRVLLLDAWGPGHSRSSSGGESRVTRGAYGADDVYTLMAWESLPEWQWLSEQSALPLLHRIGVLFFFSTDEPFVVQTLEAHERLGLPTQTLDREALQQRYPQIGWGSVELGLFEPAFGALMARRAVQTLVAEFAQAGGQYRTVAIEPPGSPAGASGRLSSVRTREGDAIAAEQFVFACGPWLPKLFPETLGSRIFPTRQEVFYFAPPAGDRRFGPDQLPVWADFNDGDIYYGLPDLEGRGFKIAHDRHGVPFDPDAGDRRISQAALEDARTYLERRFPALAGQPLVESRVCQYENSSNGDLLIDRHPDWENVWLVGAGSGHGFKHGPAVGRYAARLVLGTLSSPEPRFSLETKAEVQSRAVR